MELKIHTQFQHVMMHMDSSNPRSLLITFNLLAQLPEVIPPHLPSRCGSELLDWLVTNDHPPSFCSQAEMAHSSWLLLLYRPNGGGRWLEMDSLCHSPLEHARLYLKRWAMFQSMSLISHIGLCLVQRAIILPNNRCCRVQKGNNWHFEFRDAIVFMSKINGCTELHFVRICKYANSIIRRCGMCAQARVSHSNERNAREVGLRWWRAASFPRRLSL